VRAIEKGIPVIHRVELAYEVSESILVGITGTNGKNNDNYYDADILNKGREKGHAYVAGKHWDSSLVW